MTRSASEAYALVLKAARGAGIPLGCAEDLAHAMQSAPAPVWDALPDALSGPFQSASREEGGRLVIEPSCAATDGPTAIDMTACGHEVYLGSLDAPLVFAVLVQAAEQAGETRFEFLFDEDGGVLLRAAGSKEPAKAPVTSRPEISDRVWHFLQLLAAKTYVPESETSRLSGAGAGLSDND